MAGHEKTAEQVVEVGASAQAMLLDSLSAFGVVRWIIRNERAIAEVLLPAVSLEPGKKWWRIGVEGETHCHVLFEQLSGIRFIEKVPADGGPGSRSIQWVGPDGEPFLKLFLVKQDGQFRVDELGHWEALRAQFQAQNT